MNDLFRTGDCEKNSVRGIIETDHKLEHLHGGDRGSWARVGRESGEGSLSARLLDVGVGEPGGEVGGGVGCRRSGDELGAVDEVALGVAEDGHLAESSLERGLELGLVVCGRPAVSSKCIVVERKR